MPRAAILPLSNQKSIPDSTAKFSIPNNYATSGAGTFRSAISCDPFEGRFDISITNIKDIAKLSKVTPEYGSMMLGMVQE